MVVVAAKMMTTKTMMMLLRRALELVALEVVSFSAFVESETCEAALTIAFAPRVHHHRRRRLLLFPRRQKIARQN
jgi:hypothetical protein